MVMTMIEREQINPLNLPFVGISELEKLPDLSGIYFALSGSQVLYVGKTLDGFNSRWQSHHKLRDLLKHENVKIAYYACELRGKKLIELEDRLREYFKPPLNTSKLSKKRSTPTTSIKFGVQLPGWFNEKLTIWAKFKGVSRASLAATLIQEDIDLNRNVIESGLTEASQWVGLNKEDFIEQLDD